MENRIRLASRGALGDGALPNSDNAAAVVVLSDFPLVR